MLRQKAYKFELRPNGEQLRHMSGFAGSCRFVYNKALGLQRAYFEAEKKRYSYVELARQLTGWKREGATQWLKQSPSQALQQALRDLDRAYTHFFAKRASFPRFKKKVLSDSFRYPDQKQFKIDQANSRLFLPKLGWVRYRNSRNILGTAKNITVSLKCGKWFASIQTEREVEAPTPPSGEAIGIDMGVARFATLSNGEFFAPLNSFKRHQKALRKAQQSLSRKVKFSANWKKAKAKVQRIHAHIAQCRHDYLHKISHAISKNHALVCMEDLKVKHMSASAKGTQESPGKRVAAKSGLNKAILDQGWGEFRRQIEYKTAWEGGFFVAVSPKNTSRTCPCCGHVSGDNRQSQAEFDCVECGYQNNADVVGAINVLRVGHAQLACEVSGAVRPPAAGTHRSDLEVTPCLV